MKWPQKLKNSFPNKFGKLQKHILQRKRYIASGMPKLFIAMNKKNKKKKKELCFHVSSLLLQY